MFAVLRFDVDDEDEFLRGAERALRTLADRDGFLGGEVGRAVEEPGLWVVATRWTSAGALRRGLSHREAKLHAVPFLQQCRAEPTVCEPLLVVDEDGLQRRHSDLIQDRSGSRNPD